MDIRVIKKKELEANFRYYPQPGEILPVPIPKARHILTLGRSYSLGEKHKYVEHVALTGPRDPRIGKDAQIIATGLKGFHGRIVDIRMSNVTIELPGRIPPRATVKLSEAVCL